MTRSDFRVALLGVGVGDGVGESIYSPSGATIGNEIFFGRSVYSPFDATVGSEIA